MNRSTTRNGQDTSLIFWWFNLRKFFVHYTIYSFVERLSKLYPFLPLIFLSFRFVISLLSHMNPNLFWDLTCARHFLSQPSDHPMHHVTRLISVTKILNHALKIIFSKSAVVFCTVIV